MGKPTGLGCLTLKEFYIHICKEFNQGKKLPYRVRLNSGKIFQTKGWRNYVNGVSLKELMEAIQYNEEMTGGKKRRKRTLR